MCLANSTRMKSVLLGWCVCFWAMLVGLAPAQAQIACPDSSARTNQTGRYAYNMIERNIGGTPTCGRNVAIPQDGIRVFSSWSDCRSGRFTFVRETSGGAAPTSLICPNCASTGVLSGIVRPGTSSAVTAFFSFPDNSTARYTATISRSLADGNGNYVCSISNASVAGGAFGGDITAPAVTIGALSATGLGSYTAAITLSEPAGNGTAFELGDLTLTNASATLSGSGTSFTATLTPSADGLFGLQVPAGGFQDVAGNANTAAALVSATHDGTAPTVVLSGLPAEFSANASFSIGVTFSETVQQFSSQSISATNAIVVSVSGSGASYTVSLRATGRGDVSVRVPAGQAFDAAGNGNAASNTVSSRNRTVTETLDLIANYLTNRAMLLASNQPDLTCMLSGTCEGGAMDVSVSRGRLSFRFDSRADWPIWFRLSGSRAISGNAESDYIFGSFGMHRELGPNVLAGLMLQFDDVDYVDADASASGTGWLVGPYVVARLPGQQLYVEGAVLWGQARNRVSPFGTYTDSFRSDRALARLGVSGRLEVGQTTVTPHLSAVYVRETQLAYWDSLGNVIPQQGVDVTQVEVGVGFERPAFVVGNLWTMRGDFSGTYTSTRGAGAASAFAALQDGFRGRFELSATRRFGSDSEVRIGGYYDGIGARDYEAYGIELGVLLNF